MKKNKGEIIKRMKNNKGITLLALAVTIVVLLILTSIGIKLALGNNGIIGEAKNAKELAEIDEEKGIVKRATTVSLIKSKGSKVEQDTLEKALNDETGEGKTAVSDVGDVLEVVFVDSNRYYEVDEEGSISDVNKITKDNYAGDITKGGRCDGSEERPYEINWIEDLVALSNIVNGEGIKFENGQIVQITKSNGLEGKNIILVRNLNFKSKYSYADSTRTDFGNINGNDTDGNMLIGEMTTGNGFVSIGYHYSNLFAGIFDGNGKNISNIMIRNTERTVQNGGEGLFGVTGCDSKIINLTVSGNIDGGIQRTGGIVGFARENTKILNCRNKCNIKSKGNVGGIAGTIDGTTIIINSDNTGNLEVEPTNDSYVSAGGIAGIAQNYIVNCYNSGNVKNNAKGVYKGAGGIAGNSKSYIAYIYNCYNVGNVIGVYSEGSILGGYWYSNWISIIKNCYYLKDASKYVIGSNVTTQEFDATECTREEMQSTEILNKLNEYVESYNQENKDNEDFVELKYWKRGNNGYPTFVD